MDCVAHGVAKSQKQLSNFHLGESWSYLHFYSNRSSCFGLMFTFWSYFMDCNSNYPWVAEPLNAILVCFVFLAPWAPVSVLLVLPWGVEVAPLGLLVVLGWVGHAVPDRPGAKGSALTLPVLLWREASLGPPSTTGWKTRATESKMLPAPKWKFGRHSAMGFPGGSAGRESSCNVGDPSLIPQGSERSPGEGNDHLLQCCCLENPMNWGDWWATVHGVQRLTHNWVCPPRTGSTGTPGVHRWAPPLPGEGVGPLPGLHCCRSCCRQVRAAATPYGVPTHTSVGLLLSWVFGREHGVFVCLFFFSCLWGLEVLSCRAFQCPVGRYIEK